MKNKNIALSLLLTIFFISFAVVFTVFFKPLYYYDITHLHITDYVSLSIDKIKENYDILIQYQSIFYRGDLQFPDFIMSESGRIHFQEVKNIFVTLQVIMVISGIVSIPLIYKNIKHKNYYFLKLTSILSVGIPAVIGMLASVNFDQAFVLFHQIVFRNDYWLFDETTDPIITILPESFFMHCFMLIIFIVILCSLICYGIYRYQCHKIIKELENE